MNTLTILLAQTKSEATFEIIFMLMGCAIIGYMTAWLFYNAVYEKRIKVIESEKHELNNGIFNLDAEIFNLKKNLSEKGEETEQLTLEVRALEALHSEAVHETDYRSEERRVGKEC